MGSPAGSASSASSAARGAEGRRGARGSDTLRPDIGHMTHPFIVNKFKKKPVARLVEWISTIGSRRPGAVVSTLLGIGFLAGAGAGLLGTAGLRAQVSHQQAQIDVT